VPTVYSLTHTAICTRIILSHGKVNIFNLRVTSSMIAASLAPITTDLTLQ